MAPRRTTSARTVRALFIGNSFTARNDVPGLIAALAAAAGHTLEHALVSAGGASLRRHWNAGEAGRLIASGRFDTVVLQEQSTLPVKNARRMHENVRLFHEAIQKAGARTVLYMTWARASEPRNQDVIAGAYTSIGSELGATVAPVGLAWARHLSTDPAIALHDRDGSHPSLAGSWLAACVLAKVMFGEIPASIEVSVPGLDPGVARRLRDV